jgi:hypothetical protein
MTIHKLRSVPEQTEEPENRFLGLEGSYLNVMVETDPGDGSQNLPLGQTASELAKAGWDVIGVVSLPPRLGPPATIGNGEPQLVVRCQILAKKSNG